MCRSPSTVAKSIGNGPCLCKRPSVFRKASAGCLGESGGFWGAIFRSVHLHNNHKLLLGQFISVLCCSHVSARDSKHPRHFAEGCSRQNKSVDPTLQMVNSMPQSRSKYQRVTMETKAAVSHMHQACGAAVVHLTLAPLYTDDIWIHKAHLDSTCC